jgi:hypothetical protein
MSRVSNPSFNECAKARFIERIMRMRAGETVKLGRAGLCKICGISVRISSGLDDPKGLLLPNIVEESPFRRWRGACPSLTFDLPMPQMRHLAAA